MLSGARARHEVARRLARRGSTGTAWVGVDGRGGSGKTRWARRLLGALPRARLVQVDDFARPGVASWDHDLFRTAVVQPLQAGRPARWWSWDLARDEPVAERRAEPGDVLVVEGVSATDLAVTVPWDVTVWVEASEVVRHARLRARDGEQVWQQRWRPDWLPSEERYVAAQHPRERADLVVDGERPS